MPPSANQDNAIIEAAKLAFDHAWRGVFGETTPARINSAALVPLFGIIWRKKVIAAVDNRPINRRVNHLLARVRNSPLSRADYERLADLSRMAFFAPVDCIPEWEEWRTAADRYRFDRRRPWRILASAVSRLIADDVRSPLAELGPAALEQLTTSIDERCAVRDFWRADRIAATKASSADPLCLRRQNVDAHAFCRAIKRNQKELPRTAPPRKANDVRLRHPADYDRIGPADRIQALRISGLAATRIDRFAQDQTQYNLLKQVRGSVPASSSAMNSYAAFCDLREVAPFPASEQLVLGRAPCFPTRRLMRITLRAFGKYVSAMAPRSGG